MKQSIFKLRLLFPDSNMIKLLKPVISGAVTDVTNHLHEDGLYSPKIFGVIGSPERNKIFSFIDLHVDVLHPLIYDHLTKLSAFYKGILEGKRYATYDTNINDFVTSNSDDGNTGYTFFLSKLNEVQITRNSSKKRDEKIDAIYEYRKKGTLTSKYLLVLPAGLREFREDDGRIVEDEVNDLYRTILNTSTLFKNNTLKGNELYLLDTARLKMQNGVKNIYDYFISVNDGKHKFINGKWTKAAIENGTANVATSIPLAISNMDDDHNLTINDTVVGLFQYAKAIAPITTHHVRNKFLSGIFSDTSNQSLLVDMKSHRSTIVNVKQKTKDKWTTQSGLNSIMSKLIDDGVKNEPIRVDGYYLLMVLDTGSSIKIVLNTDELSVDLDLSKLRPITYGELFYLSIMDTVGKYPAYITRYPITGQGSTLPTWPYVKTTTVPRKINFYHDINSDAYVTIREYPKRNIDWVNSISPHYTKLAGLGLDFDGDKIDMNVMYEKETILELTALMNDPSFYISPNGSPISSLNDDVLNNVIATLTKKIN